VLLESPKALMSSQYFCGTSRPDTSHIINVVFIRDGNAGMQHVRALIDCGVTSIFMSPRLQKRLGLADEPAYITTIGLNGQVMAHASDCRRTAFTVQYMNHLSPVRESEMLVVPPSGLTTWFWDCLGSSPGILTSIGIAVDFWLCEPQWERKWWQWTG
jgi:hypothetical protein